jgi:hypothetical protein
MGPIGFPEALVRNYHYWLRNNPEERISHKNCLLQTYCNYMFRLVLNHSKTARQEMYFNFPYNKTNEMH